MNASNYLILHIIHVVSIIGFIGAVCYRMAPGGYARRWTHVWAVLAGAATMFTGMLMTRGLYEHMPVWVWVKIGCFLGIGACSMLAYRRRTTSSIWLILSLTFAAGAVVMVYMKPF